MMFAFLALALFSGPRIEADVVYAKVAGRELKMDLYYPQPAPKVATGAVVVIHGGAWMGGDRTQMAELCQEIAKRGLFAATVQYRLAPEFKWPAMLDDVQTAVRFLRENANRYNLDPKRIGASGASAGGHLALMLGANGTWDAAATLYKGQSSRVAAVLNLFGPTDLANDFPASVDQLLPLVLGKPRAQAGEIIRRASPVTHIDERTAPVFTIHGDADPLVPVRQAARLHEALKARGIPNEVRIIGGMGHEVARTNPECRKAMEDGLDWLARALGPKG